MSLASQKVTEVIQGRDNNNVDPGWYHLEWEELKEADSGRDLKVTPQLLVRLTKKWVDTSSWRKDAS